MKKVELFLKNIFLQLLILFCRKGNSSATCFTPTDKSKILLIRLNKIGDALVTTPLIKEIKTQTSAEINILADKKNYFIFENNQHVNEVLIFNKGLKNIIQLIKLLNKKNYDFLIDLHDDVSTTVSFLAAFSNAKIKLALEKENQKIYSRTIKKLNPQNHHVIERINELGKLISVSIETDNTNIHYSPASQSFEKVDNYLISNYTNLNYLVGINISAGSDARFWGVEKYTALVEYFKSMNVKILLMTDLKDTEKALAISNKNIPIYQTPSFDEFSAMISKLNFLVTPDTSIVHIASAFLVPVFGLYVKYNTRDMIWSPYRSDFEFVVTEEPTLHNISTEQVIKKLKPFFENKYYEYQNSRL